MNTGDEADDMTGDGSVQEDGSDGDLDNDLDDDLDDDLDNDLDDDLIDDLDNDLDDDLIERLRRLDPVDIEALPSSRSVEAMRTLEEILGPDNDESQAEEPEAGPDESSPSPAAGDRGGREAPPPCPT